MDTGHVTKIGREKGGIATLSWFGCCTLGCHVQIISPLLYYGQETLSCHCDVSIDRTSLTPPTPTFLKCSFVGVACQHTYWLLTLHCYFEFSWISSCDDRQTHLQTRARRERGSDFGIKRGACPESENMSEQGGMHITACRHAHHRWADTK